MEAFGTTESAAGDKWDEELKRADESDTKVCRCWRTGANGKADEFLQARVRVDMRAYKKLGEDGHVILTQEDKVAIQQILYKIHGPRKNMPADEHASASSTRTPWEHCVSFMPSGNTSITILGGEVLERILDFILYHRPIIEPYDEYVTVGQRDLVFSYEGSRY